MAYDAQVKLLELGVDEKGNPTAKPTAICYTIPFLKRIIEKFPDEHVYIFAYLYFMTNASPSNPYFNTSIYEREFTVLEDLECTFDIEDPLIVEAKKRLHVIYDLPSSKAYTVISEALNQIATQIISVGIMDWDPVKIKVLQESAKVFKDLKKQFDETRQDIVTQAAVEKTAKTRGNVKKAYDG